MYDETIDYVQLTRPFIDCSQLIKKKNSWNRKKHNLCPDTEAELKYQTLIKYHDFPGSDNHWASDQ